jgi:hypothetical protein
MKLLISKDELLKLRSCDLVPFECEICQTTFYKKKHYAMRGLKGTRNYSACSKSCWKKILRKRKFHGTIELKCDQCHNQFQRNKALHLKVTKLGSKHCFCSQKCSRLYTRHSFGRRSTLEEWIESKLKIDFPNLAINYNDQTTIDGELDIFIPSMGLAFEINGLGHYRPIYGGRAYSKRIKKDKEKAEECQVKKIELYVIDCREFTHHINEARDMKYYDLIRVEINARVLGNAPQT